MYSTAIIVPLFAGKASLTPIAVLLVLGYLLYAWMTFRGESAGMADEHDHMYLWRIVRRVKGADCGEHPSLAIILIQVVVSLAVMVKGAHTFVQSLEHISKAFGMNPLVFSLLLAPVATELPEKFNSVTWTWKGRDTLAMGNITGAMVFQATFPVSVGLLYTDWNLTGMALFSTVLAMLSVVIVMGSILLWKRIHPVAMLLGGGLYLVYAAVLVLR
jgi:cation:H+ antiporter